MKRVMIFVMVFFICLSFVNLTEVRGDTNTTLDWSQFLGNEEMRSVSDAKTPVSGANLNKRWDIITGDTPP